MFRLPEGTEPTSEVVLELITRHKQELLPTYIENREMYRHNYEILHREKRQEYKPDNKLVVPMAKYIVDTFNGFFMGIPVKETHDIPEVNDYIKDFNRRNILSDHESELSKACDIYGHAFEHIYQNEDSETELFYNSPENEFIVYDNSVKEKTLFAVRYAEDEENGLVGEIYTSTHVLNFTETQTSSGGTGRALSIDDPDESNSHHFGAVPVVEYVQNEERQGVFEGVKTLMNALNKALSAKADDVEYFADAYIAVIGAKLDDKQLANLRDKRMINVYGSNAENIKVMFMEKPNADTTQENLLVWLLDLIYQTAMVSNVNDEKFSNASGTALEIKLQPMSNMALTKERKFTKAMMERYRMVFNLPNNIPERYRNEWQNINLTFTQNMPRNITDEVNNFRNLEGAISKDTQLRTLSFIDDPQEEIKKMEESKPSGGTYDLTKLIDSGLADDREGEADG